MIEEAEVEVDELAPVIEDDFRRRLVWTMAEYFKCIGASSIQARLPGWTPPSPFSGTLFDCRPDLTCVQPTQMRRSLCLDAFDPTLYDEDSLKKRWPLFSNAAILFGGEFHVVVPAWDPIEDDPEQLVRRLAKQLEITVAKVWKI